MVYRNLKFHHRDSSSQGSSELEGFIYIAAGFSLRILTHPEGCGYIGYALPMRTRVTRTHRSGARPCAPKYQINNTKGAAYRLS
jgi:hypothetical protein